MYGKENFINPIPNINERKLDGMIRKNRKIIIRLLAFLKEAVQATITDRKNIVGKKRKIRDPLGAIDNITNNIIQKKRNIGIKM